MHRYKSLDGLRGVAALTVLFLHVTWPNYVTPLTFFRHAYVMVDLFFILSGFVLAEAYGQRIKTGGDAGRFLTLRFFRIWPTHIIMLAALVALEVVKMHVTIDGVAVSRHPFTGGDSLDTLWLSAFLLQGLGFLPYSPWNGPSWSISVEAVAYVVFATSVLIGFGRSAFNVLVIPAAVVAYASVLAVQGNLDGVSGFVPVTRGLAGFAIGVFLSHIADKVRLTEAGEGALLSVVAVAVLAAISAPFQYWEAIAVPLIAALVFLASRDAGPVAKFLCSTPVAYLGRISYSLYMVQVPVLAVVFVIVKRFMDPFNADPAIVVITRVGPWLGTALWAVSTLSVLIAAHLVHVLIEAPGREFGRRLVAGAGASTMKGGSLAEKNHGASLASGAT
jgi:peptidoglycan/LPS O-acetylase OafA/YrhL